VSRCWPIGRADGPDRLEPEHEKNIVFTVLPIDIELNAKYGTAFAFFSPIGNGWWLHRYDSVRITKDSSPGHLSLIGSPWRSSGRFSDLPSSGPKGTIYERFPNPI
jgi:hypothetical protein